MQRSARMLELANKVKGIQLIKTRLGKVNVASAQKLLGPPSLPSSEAPSSEAPSLPSSEAPSSEAPSSVIPLSNSTLAPMSSPNATLVTTGESVQAPGNELQAPGNGLEDNDFKYDAVKGNNGMFNQTKLTTNPLKTSFMNRYRKGTRKLGNAIGNASKRFGTATRNATIGRVSKLMNTRAANKLGASFGVCTGRVKTPNGLPILFRMDEGVPVYTIQQRGRKGIEAFEGSTMEDVVNNVMGCDALVQDQFRGLSNNRQSEEANSAYRAKLAQLKVRAMTRINSSSDIDAILQEINSSNIKENDKTLLKSEIAEAMKDYKNTRGKRINAMDNYLPLQGTNYLNPKRIAEAHAYGKVKTAQDLQREKLRNARLSREKASRNAIKQKSTTKKVLKNSREYKEAYDRFRSSLKKTCGVGMFGRVNKGKGNTSITVRNKFGKPVMKSCNEMVKYKNSDKYYNLQPL